LLLFAHFTPGIMMDVSAMFVASMHLRVLGGVGAKTWAFLRFSWAANIEHVRTLMKGEFGRVKSEKQKSEHWVYLWVVAERTGLFDLGLPRR
jgi:hypothetical protein